MAVVQKWNGGLSSQTDVSAKEKFDAAVRVVQSIPRNGSFQPSHEMMLKFYAYFKQASVGRCNIAKPAFWDVVGKAKWDAWHKLGDMSQEEAMQSYVEELKKIIETMPQTQMVEEFVDKLGSFYEIVDDGALPAVSKALSTGLKDKVMGGGAARRTNGNGVMRTAGAGDSPSSSSSSSSSESDSPPSSPAATAPHSNNDTKTPVNGRHHSPAVNGGNEGRVNGTSKPVNGVGATSSLPLPSAVPYRQPVLAAATAAVASVSDVAAPVKDDTGLPVLEAAAHDSNHDDDGDDSVSTLSGDSDLEFCDTSDIPDVIQESMVDVAQDSGVYTMSPYVDIQRAGYSVTTRGGGEQPGAGSQIRGRAGSNASMASQRGQGASQLPPSRQGGGGRGVGGGGGGNSGRGCGGSGSGGPPAPLLNRSELNEQIAVVLLRLQQDMNNVLDRLRHLEDTLAHQAGQQQQLSGQQGSAHRQIARRSPWWWPFGGLSRRSVAVVLLWPFIAHWIIQVVLNRRRNRRSAK